jgi:hypothetical protein
MYKWLMGVVLCGLMSGRVMAVAPETMVVEPLCKATVAWNQTGALNAFVDLGMGYPCGCDMLAWGQVAVHYGLSLGYPAASWLPTPVTSDVALYDHRGNLINFEQRTTLPGPYNWNDIRDQKSAASRLMRDLGALGHSAYRPGATSGTLGNLGFAKYFNYKGEGYKLTMPLGNGRLIQEDWPQVITASVRGSLQAGAPTVVGILTKTGGHMIVCDGFGYDAEGKEVIHLHYGWGAESGKWLPMSWFWTFGAREDEFQALFFNVHPQVLKGIVAGRVTREGQGVPGVRLRLVPATDTATAPAFKDAVTTDAVGAYCFTGVEPGATYTLIVEEAGQRQEHTVTVREFVDDTLRAKRQDQWENEHGKDGAYIPLSTGNTILDIAL